MYLLCSFRRLIFRSTPGGLFIPASSARYQLVHRILYTCTNVPWYQCTLVPTFTNVCYCYYAVAIAPKTKPQLPVGSWG